MTVDRVGIAVTAMSGTYLLAGAIIDEVNNLAEAGAVVLAAVGVIAGLWRVVKGVLRVIRRGTEIAEIVETLPEMQALLLSVPPRLDRIEDAMGLKPERAATG